MTFSLGRLSDWVEGVTPTWVECPHGVKITVGAYLKPQIPTGDHPECLAALLRQEEDELAEGRADAIRLTYE